MFSALQLGHVQLGTGRDGTGSSTPGLGDGGANVPCCELREGDKVRTGELPDCALVRKGLGD